jgi:hypothetical protein
MANNSGERGRCKFLLGVHSTCSDRNNSQSTSKQTASAVCHRARSSTEGVLLRASRGATPFALALAHVILVAIARPPSAAPPATRGQADATPIGTLPDRDWRWEGAGRARTEHGGARVMRRTGEEDACWVPMAVLRQVMAIVYSSGALQVTRTQQLRKCGIGGAARATAFESEHIIYIAPIDR